MAETLLRLNLGCSDRRIDGCVNVDIAPPADQIVDLAGIWPWADSTVDDVLAYDVCEHIGDCDHATSDVLCTRCARRGGTPFGARLRHPLGRIHFLNELHRVMKPGARAMIETPNAARGVGYFQDPTHVSPWCLSTFKYFESGSFAHGRLGKAYGITAAFKLLMLDEVESSGEHPVEKVWKIKAWLEAAK